MLALRCSTPIYGGYNRGGRSGLPVVLALRCSTPIYGGYNGGRGSYLSCCPCDVVRLYTGVITGEEEVTCPVALAM